MNTPHTPPAHSNLNRLTWVAAIASMIGAGTSVVVLVVLWQQTTATEETTKRVISSDGGTDSDRPIQQNRSNQVTTSDAGLPLTIPSPVELDTIPHLGRSVGFPHSGSLFDGKQFPPGEGYIVRHPERAWAAPNTIFHLKKAFEKVVEKYPNARRFAVGDLSWRTGGEMSGHRSHQSGRDVDVFFYQKRHNTVSAQHATQSLNGVEVRMSNVSGLQDTDGLGKRRKRQLRLDARKAMRKQIQLGALLEFIIAVSHSRDDPSGVAWIMLDYVVQEWLVSFGEKRGYDAQLLTELFQVPHGPAAGTGLVRHYPNHLEHLHIRFKCPPADRYCHSPKIGPAAQFNHAP